MTLNSGLLKTGTGNLKGRGGCGRFPSVDLRTVLSRPLRLGRSVRVLGPLFIEIDSRDSSTVDPFFEDTVLLRGFVSGAFCVVHVFPK